MKNEEPSLTLAHKTFLFHSKNDEIILFPNIYDHPPQLIKEPGSTRLLDLL